MDKKLVVNYVAAPPGAGKTRAAIGCMKKHIQEGLQGRKVGYIFYVTPTIKLLQQTFFGLKEILTEDESSMVWTVYSKKYTGSLPKTAETVMDVLNGNFKSAFGTSSTFAYGSILFITHDTFLKLRYHKKMAETTVIFDESRKWVTAPQRIDMQGAAGDLFEDLFSSKPLVTESGYYKNIQILEPKPIAENKKAKLFRYKDQGRVFKILTDLHTQLSAGEDDYVRSRVYTLKRGNTMIHIRLPSRPFAGFRKVYVLSADFKTSQMYHLMKLEGCRMQDMTVEFIQEHIKEGYSESVLAIHNRYDDLYILPLLADDTKPSSKFQLSLGLALPKNKVNGLNGKMKEGGLTTLQLRYLMDHLRDPSSSVIRKESFPTEFVDYLSKIGAKTNILEWQVKRAIELAVRWKQKFPCRKPGIMFVNKDDNNFNLQKQYDYLSVGKAEGNNDHIKTNLVCFLAAINPDRETTLLLNAILGHQGYNADEDYVVDKAIQCIGRGNIRNKKSKDKMLAIVSNLYLARKICDRMHDRPTVMVGMLEKLGNYVTWQSPANTKKLRDTKYFEDKKRRDKVAKTNYHIDPVNKELAKLRVYRRRAELAGQTDKLVQLNQRIDELIAQREGDK